MAVVHVGLASRVMARPELHKRQRGSEDGAEPQPLTQRRLPRHRPCHSRGPSGVIKRRQKEDVNK